MPRPNHDISNLALGGIRDFADEHDISDEAAHEELLRYSLYEAGILDSQPSGHIAEANQSAANE